MGYGLPEDAEVSTSADRNPRAQSMNNVDRKLNGEGEKMKEPSGTSFDWKCCSL